MAEQGQPAQGSITIVGLGPGSGDLLTRQAWRALAGAERVYLRTARHPAVADLPADVRRESFDHIYDSAEAFAHVYEEIVAELVARARQGEPVVYAVPGHPHVAEATVTALVERAEAEGFPLRVVPGLSFVEPSLTALNVDALTGLQLFDALTVAAHHHPPVNPDAPLLLGQVYNRLIAGELKLALMAVYPDEYLVSLVHAAGTDAEQIETVPLYAIDRSPHIDHLTSLYVPPFARPASLVALAEAVAVLRSPEGCPWDQEQTPQSLRAGLVEEMAEVLEALDTGDTQSLREELGDLLLHIVMQAQMAREEEQFRLNEIIGGIYAKIKRRHPHVWGDWDVSGSEEVVANWDAIKAQEKADAGRQDGPPSLLDGIPPTLPALAQAHKIQARVRKVGFDWPSVEGVVAKLEEEIHELEKAEGTAEQRAELGDILFALVNWARWLGLDAEAALREANVRFMRRFRLLEQLAVEKGVDLDAAGLDQLEAFWQQAKGILAESQE
jgi:tetrapyrrole methylase family protein/MazG family protein